MRAVMARKAPAGVVVNLVQLVNAAISLNSIGECRGRVGVHQKKCPPLCPFAFTMTYMVLGGNLLRFGWHSLYSTTCLSSHYNGDDHETHRPLASAASVPHHPCPLHPQRSVWAAPLRLSLSSHLVVALASESSTVAGEEAKPICGPCGPGMGGIGGL